jgi:hypothetical protein
MGDLNGDGALDLAVSNFGVPTVSVFLGDGAGGFGAKTDFATASPTNSVGMADLNGDGHLDLVAANFGANSVSVLLGNGAGSFGAKTDFATGLGPWGIAFGDVSGDGRADLAVANYIAGTVSVLLGNGTGGFGTKTDYTVGPNPRSVAIGDLNGDGRPDLVVANYSSNTVSVLLGDGVGGFGAKTDFPTGGGPWSVAIRDLNGDGQLDVAVANQDVSSVSVLPGTGTGSFGARTDYTTGPAPWCVAIADVNGDSRLDLLTANSGAPTVSVLLGNGSGTFGTKADFTAGAGPRYVATGDLNADGRLDLVTANQDANTISVVLGLIHTRTVMVANPNPVMRGSPLFLVAAAPPLAGTGTPTGTMSFFDGTTLLATAPLLGGTAALTVAPPMLGMRSLTAVYRGDATFAGSSSAALLEHVIATPAPVIASIADIANDQGREVRLRFQSSGLDFAGATIVRYEIFRQIGAGLGPARANAARGGGAAPAVLRAPAKIALDGWDFVGTCSATCDPYYSLVVPTLADSNASGFHRATFLVRAETATPSVYYDSAPDSGYSVDNLPPATPAPFTGAYAGGATHLHWGANGEPDLWYYRVYRGGAADFVPGTGNLIATRSDTGCVDVGPAGGFYKLSAVDVNGNESGYALLTPSGTTDVPVAGAVTLALEGAQPNPSRGEGLGIAFALPSSASARLDLLDVSGRRVATREVGTMGAGRHVVDLAAGRLLAPGLYVVRLTQGGEIRIARVAVLR